MDAAYKLFLLFIVTFFLIINARVDETVSKDIAYNDMNFESESNYSFVQIEPENTFK